MFKENFFAEQPASATDKNQSENEKNNTHKKIDSQENSEQVKTRETENVKEKNRAALSADKSTEIKGDGRFIFSTDKKETSHNMLPSEKDISDCKQKVFDYKNMLSKDELEENGIQENPEFIKEVKKIKNEVTEFAKGRGIDVTEYLPKNENIYDLDDELFEVIAGPDKRTRGKCLANEVFVRKSLNEVDKPSTLRHELIHSVSKVRILLRKTNTNKLNHVGISCGYNINNQKPEFENDGNYLENFNEGLTELTNLQIALEYEGECTDAILYIANVIFISELVKDLTTRINLNPEKVKDAKLHPSLNKELMPKDVLTHLQIGMFENDPRYLEIISNFYNDESNNFNALKTLSKMGNTKDVLETAKAFGLTEAITKLNKYIDKKPIELDIADFTIPLNN